MIGIKKSLFVAATIACLGYVSSMSYAHAQTSAAAIVKVLEDMQKTNAAGVAASARACSVMASNPVQARSFLKATSKLSGAYRKNVSKAVKCTVEKLEREGKNKELGEVITAVRLDADKEFLTQFVSDLRSSTSENATSIIVVLQTGTVPGGSGRDDTIEVSNLANSVIDEVEELQKLVIEAEAAVNASAQ